MKTKRSIEFYRNDEYYGKIPESTIESLMQYVENRIPTGDFLRSVLKNDFFGAVGRADHLNSPVLKEICIFNWNEIPFICWGSEQRVREWLSQKEEVKP